jgi:elongation factor 1-alpha
MSKKTDVGIVITGSVDSGKSSTIGVLISDELDNGNGSARQKVAKHQHELNSGQTSDISTRTIENENKIITLIDLCGHEKYLKTTTFGITGFFPDYAIVTVASNRGILRMTREHLGILFYMKIPTIVLITRTDIAPDDIYNNTEVSIKKICAMFNKKAVFVNSRKEAELLPEEQVSKESNNYEMLKDLVSKMQHSDEILPVIATSNKTGFYINSLKKILFELEPRKLWSSEKKDSIFYVESLFNPPGIGLVVSGILKGKSIRTGDNVFVGPIDNKFYPIRIRSIHNNVKELVDELEDHQRGCFAISCTDKKIELLRRMFTKGVVIISNLELAQKMTWNFKAEIEILHHSATIREKYSPVLHIGPIRQSASIIKIHDIIKYNENKKIEINDEDNSEKISIRTKDKAIVEFKFVSHQEFLEKDMIFFFREGTTRGVGRII